METVSAKLHGLPLSALGYSNVRPLPVALARRIIVTAPCDPYMATLERLFKALPRAQRAECLFETVRAWEDSLVAECVAATGGNPPGKIGVGDPSSRVRH